jgi:hypothetical protein
MGFVFVTGSTKLRDPSHSRSLDYRDGPSVLSDTWRSRIRSGQCLARMDLLSLEEAALILKRATFVNRELGASEQ